MIRKLYKVNKLKENFLKFLFTLHFLTLGFLLLQISMYKNLEYKCNVIHTLTCSINYKQSSTSALFTIVFVKKKASISILFYTLYPYEPYTQQLSQQFYSKHSMNYLTNGWNSSTSGRQHKVISVECENREFESDP